MLTIVGGCYRERCSSPNWNRVFGSAVRASAAVSGLVAERNETLLLQTAVDATQQDELNDVSRYFQFSLNTTPRTGPVEFQYDHPMGLVRLYPPRQQIVKTAPLAVEGEVVLAFSMMESEITVSSNKLVFDPQSGSRAHPDDLRGLTCDELAIVANAEEAASLVGHLTSTRVATQNDAPALASALLRNSHAKAVVVKNGIHGCGVAFSDQVLSVPSFVTPRVFSIGSGDVFSGVFAFEWGINCRSPDEAAMTASRAAALYCATGKLGAIREELDNVTYPPANLRRQSAKVYLAGPLSTVSERWILNECRRCFDQFGIDVFSPKDDVGLLASAHSASDAQIIARADIAGLDEADAVFAILDGLDAGTLIEVGYALSAKKPVVALAERVADHDLVMVRGLSVPTFDDFTTAVYSLAWDVLSR